MKKLFYQLLLITAGDFQLHAQNIGIGTTTPTRGKLEVVGVAGTGSTAAIFSSGGTGVSIQPFWPTIGFNQYRDNPSGNGKHIADGYAAIQYFDPNNGVMVFDAFNNGTANALTSNSTTAMSYDFRGNVAVGSYPNTDAKLLVDVGANYTRGLLVRGNYLETGSSTVPDLGTGSRLMFYPGKGAFRAGYVVGSRWDNNNVGFGSTALGYNTSASGNYATALGGSTTASGAYSIAMGNNTTASGNNSTALGNNATTNNQNGAFVIGDNGSFSTLSANVPNAFYARFTGGYILYSNANNNVGVYLPPNQSSWSATSSVHKKENFIGVNGEDFLEKIAALKLSSWNYKGQDPKLYRHYGPMAEDFYAAFGEDEMGVIGCDTLINQHDFISVNFIAAQALEKRTKVLAEENSALKNEVNDLKARLQKLEAMLAEKK